MRHLHRPAQIAGLLLPVAALAAAYAALAPTSIGGSAIYGISEGASMQPLLHDGDLVVVRRGGTVAIGDAVLYLNRGLGRTMLHRIVRMDGDRYAMKGDSNAFLDTYEPSRAEILGRLWFRVGGVGRWATWLGVAWHAGLLAGLATLVTLLGAGLRAGLRWRQRRGAGGGEVAWPPAAATSTALAATATLAQAAAAPPVPVAAPAAGPAATPALAVTPLPVPAARGARRRLRFPLPTLRRRPATRASRGPRYDHLIVDAASARERAPEREVAVASFAELAALSDRHGRMILRVQEHGRTAYLVEESAATYRFEPSPRPAREGDRAQAAHRRTRSAAGAPQPDPPRVLRY